MKLSKIKLITLITFLVLMFSLTSCQVDLSDKMIPGGKTGVLLLDNGNEQAYLVFGIHPNATKGLDEFIGEKPVEQVSGGLNARFALSGQKTFTQIDVRPESNSTQYDLIYEHADELKVTYHLPTGASMRITDTLTGKQYDSGDLLGRGSIKIQNLSSIKIIANWE